MEAQSKSVVPAISDNVSATAGSEATDNKSGLSALHSACNNAFQLQRFPPFAPHSFQRSLRLSQFLLNVEQLPQIICFIVKITHKMVKDTIQYNIRLLEAVRTQRRTIIEREKYVENENVKMVARSGPVTSMCLCTTYA